MPIEERVVTHVLDTIRAAREMGLSASQVHTQTGYVISVCVAVMKQLVSQGQCEYVPQYTMEIRVRVK